MIRYIFLSLILMTVSAHATDTYYCDTGDDTTGAGTKASPWQTYSKAITTLDGGSAGDRIFLCEGGEFTAVNTPVNTTCTANDWCYVTSYQPDDIDPADVGVKPHVVVDSSGINKGIVLDSGASYIYVSNLHIQADAWTGTGDQTWGIWIYEEVTNVIFDGLVLEDLGSGLNLSGSVAPNIQTANITFKNSHFENNWAVGLIGGPKSFKVYDNTFNLNGSNGGGRPIYIGGFRIGSQTGEGEDFIISGNVMTNSAPSDIGNGAYAGVWTEGTYGCNRDAFGGHGYMQRTLIKNNIVREDKETAALAPGGCWAFTVDTAWNYTDEHFVDLVFQNNEAYYAGNVEYACSNCDGVIFRENIGYGINGGVLMLAANRPEDTPHPTETMYAYYNLLVHEKVETGNAQVAIESRHYEAAAVVADIQWNVLIFADNDANNRCTYTDAGSTTSNNFCFNVDASGNFVVNSVNTVK